MANIGYARQQIGLYLKHFRINSMQPSVRTQVALGIALGIDQKRVSNIECGYDEPSIKIAAKWCEITGWYEGWDMLTHMYRLDPFSLAPVDPILNQDVSDAILNLKKQLIEAGEAIGALEKEEPKLKRMELKGVRPMSMSMQNHQKQLIDLIPAVKTLFYSLQRSGRANMGEVGSMWNNEAFREYVAMPKVEDLKTNMAL